MQKYDKSPVKLRGRKMPSGNTSLYLDIYKEGRREYEYLKLYLIPEKTKADRAQNRQTMEFAEAVRAKRIVELRNGEHGFKSQGGSKSFLVYYEGEAQKRYGTADKRHWHVWGAVYKLITRYDPRPDIRFKDITPRWVEGLKTHMDAMGLANGSKLSYLSLVNAALNSAVRAGIISQNPIKRVEGYKATETKREYLTREEVATLSKTPCSSEIVRRAFLFSCLTGLRYGDIRDLTWGEVHTQGEFTRLIFRQEKTRGQEYLDISPRAVGLMGERDTSENVVFFGLPRHKTITHILRKWVERAGIQKHITFHCARHTFATLMLDIGTDLYTVSKLLGHREISTTQIYAKIIDKNKQKAVANIPDILGE